MNRNTTSRWLFAALLVGTFPAAAAAQDTGTNDDQTGFGSTAAEFLLLGANARGTALGGSYITVATDIGGTNANPAALALITRPGAQFSQYDYVADTKLNWGGVAFPFGGGARAIGVQFGTFGFSDQPVYTADSPEGTGEVYDVSESFVGLTLAQNFSDRFSVGITLKGVFDQLGQTSGSAFALDFGTHFHSNLNGRPIRFAFALTNLGTELTYDGDAIRTDTPRDSIPGEDGVPSLNQPSVLRNSGFGLPTMFRVGLAYDVVASGNNRFTLMGEFNQASANKAAFGFGAELAAGKLGSTGFGVALRGSYTSNPANSYDLDSFGVGGEGKLDDEKMHGLALGAGLMYETAGFNVGFDYAWKDMGLLGNASFFTVSLGW